MPDRSDARKPVKVFFSYAHQDERLRDQLANHLSVLTRQGIIESWHDREISAGTEWKNQINSNLDEASIILLLISSDFLSSDYCYDIEMNRAMQRHESGQARVIPIILRPCEWTDAPFGKLQALPLGAKPVTSWKNKDKAFATIVQGVKHVIGGEELPVTVLPGKRKKRLWDWITKERHWPLLLSFIVPLYFVAGSDLDDTALLILAGITSLGIGILYWAIRRQKGRLWPSGSLGIVGAGLIIAAIVMLNKPICSQVKPLRNDSRPNSKEAALVVTIARFSAGDSDLKKHAKNFNRSIHDRLSEGGSPVAIRDYYAEVKDEHLERVEAQVRSEDCKCNVFVWAEIRRTGEGKVLADFHLINGGDLPASYKSQGGMGTIDLRNIELKNQEYYTPLITLLVGYAYYKWGDLTRAIETLKELEKEGEEEVRGAAYFYQGMCHLARGLQNSNADELKGAIKMFGFARSFAKEFDELYVASTINQSCARIDVSPYLPPTEAAEELKTAIAEFDRISERWERDIFQVMGNCDLAKMNKVVALAKQYDINPESAGDTIIQVQKAIDYFDKVTCPESRAICELNSGQLLANIGRRSEDQEFREKLKLALGNLQNALNYFQFKREHSEDEYVIENWASAANIFANTLTTRGIFLGGQGIDDLKKARDLYKEVLSTISKETHPEDWALTRLNQAITLIQLGKLGATDDQYSGAEQYYEESVEASTDAINAFSQSPGLYWAGAKSNLGTALFLLGSERADKALLVKAVEACNEANTVFAANTEYWALTEKTLGDTYLQLSALSQAAEKNQYERNTRESYRRAKLLLGSNDIIYQEVGKEIPN